MTRVKEAEQELQQAAKRVAETMLANLPSPAECEHIFSGPFEEKLDALCRKYHRKVVARRVRQRVAAVLLAAFLTIAVWLTVDAEARERALEWVKEVYQSVIVYTFHSGETGEILGTYEAAWLPEGFTLEESERDEASSYEVYMNETKEAMFTIECSLMDNTAMTITVQELSNVSVIDINGIQADFYGGNGGSEDKALVWVDEAANVVFHIQGNVSDEDIVHIARSLILTDPTK